MASLRVGPAKPAECRIWGHSGPSDLAPQPRGGAVLVARTAGAGDAQVRQAFVVGGADRTGAHFSATHVYSLAGAASGGDGGAPARAWVKRIAPADDETPPPASGAAGVFDDVNGILWLFGGMNVAAGPQPKVYNAVWRLDVDPKAAGAGGEAAPAWAAASTAGSAAPTARNEATACLWRASAAEAAALGLGPVEAGPDAGDATAGGAGSAGEGEEGGGGSRALVVVFGGSSPEHGPSNDTWVLDVSDPSSPRWHRLDTVGDAPSAREMHCAFVKPAEGEQPPLLVVLGGRGVDGSILKDMAVLDLSTLTWQRGVDTPVQRCAMAGAWHAPSNSFVVFGGWNGSEVFDDVMQLQAHGAPSAWSWSSIEPSPRIEGRFAAAAAVSGDDFLLFGGLNFERDHDELVSIRLATA